MTKSVRYLSGAIVASLLLSLPAVVSNRAPDDWPSGAARIATGTPPEKGLLKAWPAGGPPLAWHGKGAGEGYSSMAVSGGRIYTLGARGDAE